MFVIQNPPVLSQNLITAKEMFAHYFRESSIVPKVSLCPELIDHVGEMSLSKWIELLTHVFYESVYTANKFKVSNFLNFVGSLTLNRLARDISVKYQFMFESVRLAETKKEKLMQKSCVDLSKLEEQFRLLDLQSTEITQALDQNLSICLLLTQAISFLEKNKLISAVKEISLKQKILERPKEFFRELTPFFAKLVYLNVENEEEFLEECQNIFKKVFVYFGLDEKSFVLLDTLMNDLAESKYFLIEDARVGLRV
jgi:hypothetical protein